MQSSRLAEAPNAKRVAFVPISGTGWLGGTNYFYNLISALTSIANPRIVPLVISRQSFCGAEPLFWPGMQRYSLPWFSRMTREHFGMPQVGLERFLYRNSIHVISHFSANLGPNRHVGHVGWIPDFQHEHLPHLFDAKQVKTRRSAHAQIAQHADLVILSSHHAQRDFARFFPQFSTKARVLQFVSALRHTDVNLTSVASRYQLPDRYVLLPNQLWKHKNHLLVVEALGKLRQQGVDITVVCTGNKVDPGHPGHAETLLERARVLLVDDRFRLLGIIPAEDLQALMHGAMAVLNPSRFEGWSTSVEEAKSLGKLVILSDIPVHREQAPERALWFSPDDTDGLAYALYHCLTAWDPRVEATAHSTAVSSIGNRIAAFARAYEDIALEAANSYLPNNR